jgi:hypothetical protein
MIYFFNNNKNVLEIPQVVFKCISSLGHIPVTIALPYMQDTNYQEERVYKKIDQWTFNLYVGVCVSESFIGSRALVIYLF